MKWNNLELFTKFIYNEKPNTTPQEILDIYNKSLINITSIKYVDYDVIHHVRRIYEQKNRTQCLKIIGDSLLNIRRLRAKDWDDEADNFFQANSSGQQSEITGINNMEDEESQDHDSEKSSLDISDHKEVTNDQEEMKEATSDSDKEVKKAINDKVEMSEKNREKIMKAYREMDKKYMWKLSSGRIVEEELYKLGKEQQFEHAIHSFILDVEDKLIMEHFTREELEEIDSTPIPEVPELPKEVDNFLCKFLGKTNLNEIRQTIKESMFGNDYNREKHHDVDYICLALYSLVKEIENGNLKDTNLENWYNCHVWNAIFDQAFGDMVAVVRNEGASISRVTRKNENAKGKSSERHKIGRRGSWILSAVSTGNKDEFDWIDKYGTKKSKLERGGAKKNTNRLTMTIVYADNPEGYICRFRRCDLMEVPDTVENFDSVLTILASILNAKSVVQETVKMVQTGRYITKSFKNVGLRKRPRDEGQHQLPACMSTPKKIKYALK
ncbi:C2H2-type zinc finger transcription factor [Rhizophagus clarus]|uniref:C2H2-type zinc finger transcription factor n=1 Tax=Rhizophagus clarus TaxID=94130 RepID=A0A8H3LVF7_9GLOM|nr:C2H2-type zinc finger transcription factor [Rhizophagus clarus]